MNRRYFIKRGLAASGFCLTSGVSTVSFCQSVAKSPVVISQDTFLHTSRTSLDSDRLAKMLDKAVQSLFDRDQAREAWSQVARPGEVIGLKVNCLSGRGSTHGDLVEAVSERLQDVGIKPADIIIWDRFSSDLEDAGFRIVHKGNKVHGFGNETLGFESELEMFGSAGSLVCKTMSRVCDGIINLPVLRDHSIAGVTISLKNMFGAIHNPNKYHLSVGDPYIADVNMLPSIRNKTRLIICDATTAQYEGGPSFMPQWRWPCNRLLVSMDPVALDYVGWQIIEEKRREMDLPPLKEVGRQPSYIKTAADNNHLLGTNDPKRIKKIIV